MSRARYFLGEALEVVTALEAAGDVVDLVFTSPPFLHQRRYLPDDDPVADLEIGQEATPGAFVDRLLILTAALGRILAPHGSIVVELGDTYSGSGGAGGDYGPGGLRDGQPRFAGAGKARRGTIPKKGTGGSRYSTDGNPRTGERTRKDRPGWPLDKSLCLVPELYRLALAYGVNPLTGLEVDRWRVRNVVRWVRPNPGTGALSDKFRPATSDMVVVCRGRRRYFDGDAVRVPNDEGGSRPQFDWWLASTASYNGEHYAVMPDELARLAVSSMAPSRVCRTCGKPSSRIVEKRPAERSSTPRPLNGRPSWQPAAQVTQAERVTLGWSDCGHDDWRRGVVLDPFAGSGTTLMVATGAGRDAIGIDLDARNAKMAEARVGMFLEVIDGHSPAS